MKHIAVIMDGNGRWAVKRGRERSVGYRFGARALMRLAEDFLSFPISTLTVYAFSTENNKRDSKEVSNIFSVIASFLLSEVFPFCQKNGVALRFIGNLDALPDDLKQIAESNPAVSGEKTLVIAINYGGSDEILRAYEKMKEKGIVRPTEKDLYDNLDTAGLPMPDAVLRYGGYKRLSNFLPLQTIYSELFFIDKLWPDYDRSDIEKVISDFSVIKRNFGGNNA